MLVLENVNDVPCLVSLLNVNTIHIHTYKYLVLCLSFLFLVLVSVSVFSSSCRAIRYGFMYGMILYCSFSCCLRTSLFYIIASRGFTVF